MKKTVLEAWVLDGGTVVRAVPKSEDAIAYDKSPHFKRAPEYDLKRRVKEKPKAFGMDIVPDPLMPSDSAELRNMQTGERVRITGIKPEPKARELMVCADEFELFFKVKDGVKYQAHRLYATTDPSFFKGTKFIHVIEKLPGTVQISREDLAKAISRTLGRLNLSQHEREVIALGIPSALGLKY
jgi:hypothetical protein